MLLKISLFDATGHKQALASSTGFHAHGLVGGATQIRTIAVCVIASVGLGRSHTRAEAAGLVTAGSNAGLVARVQCQIRAVAIYIHTRLGCCQWRVSGACLRCAGDNGSSATHSTHPYTTLETDESCLTPSRAPAVLNKPVVYTTRVAITNHCDSMISVIAWVAAGKDTTLVQLKWPFSHDCGDDSAIGVDQLLQ
jgi:hypothetical protein